MARLRSCASSTMTTLRHMHPPHIAHAIMCLAHHDHNASPPSNHIGGSLLILSMHSPPCTGVLLIRQWPAGPVEHPSQGCTDKP